MNLQSLAKQIKNCKKCSLWKKRKNAVPGEGPARTKIMFIGLAPGKEEDKTGKPFVGRAGKFLDELLKKNKINRKKIFITSVLKCYLPSGKVPTAKQIQACKPYLLQQIKIINPKTIVLLGNVAKNVLMKEKILKNKKIIVTYHPAAGMRFPKIKKRMFADFKKI